MKKKLIVLLIIGIAIMQTRGQEITQTLKGFVFDNETQQPLVGAAVVLGDTDPQITAISGNDGSFKMEKVPVGRYDVLASYVGYEVFKMSEVLVSSGKEVVITIGLTEKVKQLKEVTISSKSDKENAVNDMALISSRQFSIEEASRYAGGLDDPARLASSFAGVAGNMSSNGIVIRGNAPKGLLWNLEGVEISNPSHFADITAFGGGGITALSSQMLTNSDFYTGAFPAEFSDALSGVFDLKLRTGNNEKQEHTFQLGALGTDISSEGPFKKGGRASYLFNYRISTLVLLKPLLPENAEGISYQDLSFKLNFPTEKSGVFSFWGLAGYDNLVQKAQEDSSQWEYEHEKERHNSKLGLAAAGFSNKIITGKNTYFHTTLALSGNGISWVIDKLDNEMIYQKDQQIKNLEWKYILSSFVNHKFSARHSNKSGISITTLNYDLDVSHSITTGAAPEVITNEKGSKFLLQAYTQSKINISEKVMMNIGVHAQYFMLNEKISIEPRAAIKWDISPLHSLSFGYGNHSQLEPLQYYMVQQQTGNGISYPNKSLDFSKSHHFILGYDYRINENFRIKVEPYLQLLYNIPVIPSTSFSMINLETGWFMNDSMANNGTGKNIGIDFTAERFLHKGYYWLFTASVFDSKYKGGDGIERNSRFNKHYVVNLLAGKEWKTGKKDNNIISANVRINAMGGDRITPVDVAASLLAHDVVFDETLAFADKKKDVLFISIGASYKRNHAKYAGTWSLQVSNLLSEKEYFGYRYNFIQNTIDPYEQTIVLPSISYKIEF
jgi:hypothetical protein